MRKYLLPEGGSFYKANLHCHSTFSDGVLTPEQIKKIYKAKGYSVVAYTDHNIFLPHPELCDESFIALNGFEIDINEWGHGDFSKKKCCHTCLVALKPETVNQPYFHRTKYFHAVKNEDIPLIKFDESIPDYEREYTPEGVSEMMKVCREKGFFVTYNHPTWSLENYNDYGNYHNMHAMEIYNHGSAAIGYDEHNEKEYDDMLRLGKRIYCLATDDNHTREPYDSREYDAFGGFVMIKAEKLEYTTITDALLQGDFYASEGPEIHELYFEDGKIFVRCSDADTIVFTTADRRAKIEYSKANEPINSSFFEPVARDEYVRITVTDKNGKKAYTNAYFYDELIK